MRRLFASVTAVSALAAVVLVLLVAPSTPASAAEASVGRAAGAGRIETAIELSKQAWPDGAPAVVIAFANGYADALAAAPVAAAADAPVLLNVQSRLHDKVRAEIRRLGAQDAYVMGGPAVQSRRVDERLRAMGLSVTRVRDDEHPDRYGTAARAAEIALDLWRQQGHGVGTRFLVALGDHARPDRAWPDALAAGALAGHARWPILLVRPTSVPEVTNATLREYGADVVKVVGGPGAIPERVKNDLAGGRKDRIAGDTRYGTSVQLALEAIRNRGASAATVVAATGENYPDGLAAGPAAYKLGGVLVLVAKRDLVDSGATKSWLESNKGTTDRVVVAGGKGAVSDETAGQIGFALTDLALRAVPVASGFDFPVFTTAPRGDDRLFVVDRDGQIEIVRDGQRLSTPFLDISSRTTTGGERGLLGLAFHPDYARNGRFYVHYTNTNGDTRVVEYRRSSNPDRANPSSARTIFTASQPYSNHNGGMLAFGPGGYLYLALGDGGSGGDPQENGQNPRTPLGGIVRIPPGDPGTWETWMYGLRNPWRFSFDPGDKRMYIGDVGQGSWEEVDVVASDAKGTNFGWDVMEGRHCYEPSSGCDRSGKTLPVLEYATHDGGTCAVTGGFVYRGDAIPYLRGQYLYADFCAGWVKSFHYRRGVVSDGRDWSGQLGDLGQIPSFGTDGHGEVYVTSTNGTVYRIAPN